MHLDLAGIKVKIRKINWKKALAVVVIITAIIIMTFSRCIDERPTSSTFTGLAVPTTNPTTRIQNTGAPVTLGTGTYTVGVDVMPGRYTATPAYGYGNLLVYDGTVPEVDEVLGEINELAGVPNVSFNLVEGQKLEIRKLGRVELAPLETKLLTTLTAGTWQVGLDIAPGIYYANADGLKTGSLVLIEGDLPVLSHAIGSDRSTRKVRLTLKTDQVIRITGIPSTVFTEVK